MDKLRRYWNRPEHCAYLFIAPALFLLVVFRIIPTAISFACSLFDIDMFLNGKGFIGLAKKMFIILFVLLGAALDTALGASVFQSMIICMYIANEGLSIIENASLLGVPIPKALRDALEIMRQKGEGDKRDKVVARTAIIEENETVGQKDKPPDVK